MKKLLIATIATGAVAVLLALTWIPAWAQSRAGGQVGAGDLLTLQGPGSTLGVSVRDLEGDEASKARTDGAGVYINEVRAGTPAEKAGLKRGDIVVEFDGERVRSARHFTRLIRETPPGRTVKSTVIRDGNRQTVDLTPAPPERFALDRFPDFSREIETSISTSTSTRRARSWSSAAVSGRR
jgi:membrane-associated protease RseP (regulator of RpoE activity)